jgi:hypothetical protein
MPANAVDVPRQVALFERVRKNERLAELAGIHGAAASNRR